MEIPLAFDPLPNSVAPYLALMVLGFIVGTGGHIARSRLVVGIGIGMIFLAVLLLPLAVIATDDTPPQPSPNAFPPGYE